jgi:hypothetical protein
VNECASERVRAGFGRAIIVRGFQYTKGKKNEKVGVAFVSKKGHARSGT